MAELYDDVAGQERAIATLRAAARAPVHAYLLVGPAGSGKRAAAVSFAASLVCRHGGCGHCDDCVTVRAGRHPDVVTKERSGAAISVEEAREVAHLAVRSPALARCQVLILTDFHLVDKAAPALLKTVEEPPDTTFFVILAERMSPDLVTIASRCCRVDFAALSAELVAAQLEREGVDSRMAAQVAEAAGGRLDRARLLVADRGFGARRTAWQSVAQRLDGSGSAAITVADELLEMCDEVLEPVRARQATEMETVAADAEARGERSLPGRREIEDRHRREQRRARTDELKFGLSTLASIYAEPLAGETTERARARLVAVTAIDRAVEALARNPNEALLLEALMVDLSALVDSIPSPG